MIISVFYFFFLSMKIKNIQLQLLQKTILDNKRVPFDAITAFRFAQISQAITPLVVEFEKILREIAQNHIITNEDGTKSINNETFTQEAMPLMETEVDVNIPERLVIKIKETMNLTTDFFTTLISIYGDNVVFEEVK